MAATWMIHNANHNRSSRIGLKVGGHQASCASAVTLIGRTIFSCSSSRGSYCGQATRGAGTPRLQYNPWATEQRSAGKFSRTWRRASLPVAHQGPDDIDFSTGSVGLGAALTLFASLVPGLRCAARFAPVHPRRQDGCSSGVNARVWTKGNHLRGLLAGLETGCPKFVVVVGL